jgi:hypothetical protein
VTDAAYREEFFEDVVGEVRRASAVRIAYLSAMDSATGGPAGE